MGNFDNELQYSYSKLNKQNNSNSTVTFKEIVTNLTDVIPEDDYMPFYASKYRKLGYKRFMELANKARAGGRDPAHLFFWMLKNNEIVR